MIRKTWIQMGMPVTVCIQDTGATEEDISEIASWFECVNQRFSPYLDTSEVCRMNAGALDRHEVSQEMALILSLCRQTTAETDGYFDPMRNGRFDPSGLVKGWAIERASALLASRGWRHHLVEAGGDVQTVGLNGHGQPWRIGIRNPFQREEMVKVVALSGRGIATSGTAIRGSHIYNPHDDGPLANDLVSLTVIAPTIYEADRMATAAFAMGRASLTFLATRAELEGYAIALDGIATYTKGFAQYVR
jgi:thiamine biosynthesis lipoprotein